MSSITLNKFKTIATACLLTSSTLAVKNVHPVYAQSPQKYLHSSCIQAYQQYKHYENQPVASLDDSGNYVQYSSHNAQMQTTSLNRVTNCALQFSKLVQKDTSYCPYALDYVQKISPIMSTTAVTVQYHCN